MTRANHEEKASETKLAASQHRHDFMTIAVLLAHTNPARMHQTRMRHSRNGEQRSRPPCARATLKSTARCVCQGLHAAEPYAWVELDSSVRLEDPPSARRQAHARASGYALASRRPLRRSQSDQHHSDKGPLGHSGCGHEATAYTCARSDTQSRSHTAALCRCRAAALSRRRAVACWSVSALEPRWIVRLIASKSTACVALFLLTFLVTSHLRDAQLERVLLGRREVLQHAQQLDLQPRRRDAVVQVVVRVVLVEHEPRERARRLWRRRLPPRRVHRHHAEDKRGDGGEHADVLLVQQHQYLVGPLARGQHVRRLAVQPQRRQRRLLAHVRLGHVGRQQFYHVRAERLGKLFAADVADGVKSLRVRESANISKGGCECRQDGAEGGGRREANKRLHAAAIPWRNSLWLLLRKCIEWEYTKKSCEGAPSTQHSRSC
eukprot:6177624-Pleurochrysis_carterae.AAC.2